MLEYRLILLMSKFRRGQVHAAQENLKLALIDFEKVTYRACSSNPPKLYIGLSGHVNQHERLRFDSPGLFQHTIEELCLLFPMIIY